MCKQKKNKKKLTQIAQITLFHTFFDPLNMSTENYPPKPTFSNGLGNFVSV